MIRLFKKTKEFIFAQQTSIFSSTIILAGMMFLSRTAGFARYRVLANYFSAGELDIFLAAFRIPDVVFEILINGALSTTFIPFFIEYQKKGKQSEIISTIINLVMILLSICILILYVVLPFLSTIITPGYSFETSEQIVLFSRLLLVGQLPFLVAGNFLTGMSQAKRAFLIPALAPIFYNIGIIVGTIVFVSSLGLMAPVLGVVIGSVLFFVIQLPVLLHVEFKYQVVIHQTREAIRFLRTAIPRILTIIVAQIDATIDLTLTTLLGSGAYTVFYFAQHLQLLPISIIGMAFGQASLPYLTDLYQEKKYDEFKKIIIDSILNILFFTIPMAAFLIIARTPIVRMFFGGKRFDWDATVWTAVTLSYFALSLPMHSLYYFLTRCFYAIFDTRTPFYISIVAIGLNAILSVSFTLLWRLPVWSLALAFSIAMNLHVILLIFLLYKAVKGFSLELLIRESSKIVISSFISSVTTYFLMRLLDGLIFDTTRTLNVFLLLALGAICFFIMYSFLNWVLSVREMYMITLMLVKAREYQKKLIELYSGVN